MAEERMREEGAGQGERALDGQPTAREAAAEGHASHVEPALDGERVVAELTDEQIAQEREFLEGVPRLSIGALFLPPIWGPAHGIWATILYYPVWLFTDNLFYAAFMDRTALGIVLAAIVGLSLAAGTVAFAIVSQPLALHRAVDKGISKETYLRREKIWTVVCVAVGCLMLAGATYYNLVIRPSVNLW